MSIAAGIVALLVTIAPLAIWLIRRRIQKADDPKEQNRSRRQEIAREIARNDERGANQSLDDDLDRLRALQSDRRRSAGPPDEGGH